MHFLTKTHFPRYSNGTSYGPQECFGMPPVTDDISDCRGLPSILK